MFFEGFAQVSSFWYTLSYVSLSHWGVQKMTEAEEGLSNCLSTYKAWPFKRFTIHLDLVWGDFVLATMVNHYLITNLGEYVLLFPCILSKSKRKGGFKLLWEEVGSAARYLMNRSVVSGYKWFFGNFMLFPLTGTTILKSKHSDQQQHSKKPPGKSSPISSLPKNDMVFLVGVGLLSTPRYSVDSQKTPHFNQ